MSNNMFQSDYKGRDIDQAIKDTASLKERMGQAENDIQYLNIHKANSNTVPKSIKDLEPNASLIYVGSDTPSQNFNIWFFCESDGEYTIRVRSSENIWEDVVSVTSKDYIEAYVNEAILGGAW